MQCLCMNQINNYVLSHEQNFRKNKGGLLNWKLGVLPALFKFSIDCKNWKMVIADGIKYLVEIM